MTRYVGPQSQVFGGVVQDIARARPPVFKAIDPDSAIFAAVKSVSPNTVTIARIYTGQPTVDDERQHPSAYVYGRQYAELVYSRVKDPAHTDYIESENEPNDHYGDLTRFIQRLNAFLAGFAERARELGFKPVGPNFSVGYPECYIQGTDYELWPNAWQGLADGLREIKKSGGALGLHEYGWPDLLAGWSDSKQLGYTIGRHKAVYRCLPPDLQDLPLYLTEYGIDALLAGQQGGFWHNRDENAPAWYMAQMRTAWDKVYRTTPQLRGACHFIHASNNPELWEEYDTTRTDTARELFVSFMQEDLAPAVPPDVTPPVNGGNPGDSMPTQTQMLNATWNAIGRGLDATGIPYNPGAAFVAKAYQLQIGPPTSKEFRADIDGVRYAFQVFRDAFLWCKEGDWDRAKAYDLLTAQPYQAQPPVVVPPPGIPPFVFPSILSAAGFIGVEHQPIAGRPFYRLAPQAAVRLSVSAFCDVTVIGKNGVPAIGVQVVSLRADGKGEILMTDGSGKARFNFGTGSAFTPPARPPFDIFIAEGATKDEDTKLIAVDAQVSDSVLVGDTRGEHTEIYLQFVMV